MKVLLVDDHKLFVDGLSEMINKMPGVDSVVTANNSQEAVRLLEKESIDIALIDIQMPGSHCSGIDLVEIVKKNYRKVKCLMISMDKKPNEIDRLIALGADGYILKDCGKEVLLMAIKAISSDREYWDDKVISSLTEFKKSKNKKSPKKNLIHLTSREMDVLKLVSEGISTKAIANKLEIGKYTVDTYRKNILIKFEVNNSSAAILKAKDFGMI
jgi:DNA-binding NarL/FixJ family response regulator